jgi:hypothetical protein
MMKKTINLQILIFTISALIFSMYQETPAQRNKKSNKKTAAVEVKPVAPTISYTISMSKPATHLLEVEMRLNWASMPEKSGTQNACLDAGQLSGSRIRPARREFFGERA